MELVTGAMGSLIPKLQELLKEEYKLQTGVKDQIRSLEKELESAHAALREVAQLRPDQLDKLVKIWAREVREASYGMEDILDTYLVNVKGSSKPSDMDSWVNRLREMLPGFLKKTKERHKLAGAIEKIRKNLQEVTERHGRYTASNIVATSAASSRRVDPARLTAMYREASQIIGIDKSSADLISKLSLEGDDESSKKMKIVSVLGFGGVGKTTLAKAVYDKLKSQFGHKAFVPVGQDPDMKKFLRDILIDLDKEKYTDMKFTTLDERQLINELHGILQTKRYLFVIDDVWEPQSWDIIKLALVENNSGSRIIITTRKFEVAKQANEVYKLESLSHDNSKKLFYTRLFGGEDKCPSTHPDDLSDMILKKCGGVPLAIITMASLLLGKSIKEWYEVCKSVGFSQDKDDRHMANTRRILALSYYDLPSHLKTCLLYLSVFPEDSLIEMDSLIWKWIAEGFVEKKPGCGLFEVGEEYFHELINRSMIMGVGSEVYGIMEGCRVHDMVLDLIVSMSHKENFVSVDGTLSQRYTRRLVLKNRELDLTRDGTDVNLPQVKSFIVWRWCAIDKWALHPRLKQIRVLALENCAFREGCRSLAPIGNLLHLRYLRIRGYGIYKEIEIGGLKFLQTLDLFDRSRCVEYLPDSIGNLTRLVFLHAPWGVLRVGVGKLTALEELQIAVRNDSAESGRQFMKDLGNLCELRVLKIYIAYTELDDSMQIDLVQSLGKLQKMQHLQVDSGFGDYINMNAWDATVLSRDLRCLFLGGFKFPKLPLWINSARLPSLSHLKIWVEDMDEQGLKALGGLPELCYLRLVVSSTTTIASSSTNTEADGFFPKLRSLVLPHSIFPSIFPVRYSRGGGMTSLEELEFCVYVKQLMMQDQAVSCGDLGLEYLPSIRKVKVEIHCQEAYEDDVEREEAAVRHTIQDHPNRPALEIKYYNKASMKRIRGGSASLKRGAGSRAAPPGVELRRSSRRRRVDHRAA